jgi:deoxyribodipyrimidine photo-lyase
MNSNRSILWFRRDLRLADHAAIARAARDGREVLALFVLDPRLIEHSGSPRLAFLYRSLHSLNESLEGKLLIRVGDPRLQVVDVARTMQANEVHVSRDFGPYGRSRDVDVSAALASIGSRLIGTGSPYAVDPGTVRKPAVGTGAGEPYSVFTPFFRTWQRHLTVMSQKAEVHWTDVSALASDPIPNEPPIGCELLPTGESAAHDRWQRFLDQGLDSYDIDRNAPGLAGTSGLSPYLRWGVLHPHQLLVDLNDSNDHQVFRSELAWRDFYADVLHHKPFSARRNLQAKMDAIEIDVDDAARQRFDLWCAGQTGYPIVDAGMRQLLATGWMHNRVRMIVASFLVKDLHLPWQWGARHFMKHLVDGDLASNQHGWQWAAGTGTDAAPYFRVFNPVTQSQRYDAQGQYLRRWVPELAHLSNKTIHQPWTSGDPSAAPPMVDHANERDVALKRYQQAMGR